MYLLLVYSGPLILQTWHSDRTLPVVTFFIPLALCSYWPFSGLSHVLQGASTSSSRSTPSTARPIWTAPVPAAPHRPLSSVWEDSASAPTAQTANLTASRAAPQSPRVAPYPATSQHFPSRSCRTFTWAVPKTPPTWMCSASTISSTSSTWRPTCPTCSNTKGTSNTSRSPSLITGARTSLSFSPRPFHSLVSKREENSVFVCASIMLQIFLVTAG